MTKHVTAWDVTVWSAVLTPAEIEALAKGLCPLLVRPNAIVFFRRET
jgi:hypothetical protein